MKFVTIESPPEGRAGVLVGEEILDLARVPGADGLPGSVRSILAGGAVMLDRVRWLVEGAAGKEQGRLRAAGAILPLTSTKLLAPIPRPNLLLSAGMNYHEHLKEMGSQPPPHPTAFIKNAESITGPGSPIVLPPQCPDMVDFEGEFSVVIGRTCHNVTPEQVMDYVAGYTIINDVSARNWVPGFKDAQGKTAALFAWELNILGKQLPTFTPMGPVVVTKDEIEDDRNLRLTTTLNGAVMQSTSTSDLVYGVREVVAHFSKWYRFVPGDVISTGSPSGVGFARKPPVFMRAGDVVAVTVEGVGTLENPVKAA
jgi:2-keto-4-pentenoate hydratase/2-oxohepta-3-ene-1,7-dioic acid hydratase in catechol pathway